MKALDAWVPAFAGMTGLLNFAPATSYWWDAQMWHPQIADLQKNYRFIVPDLWRHGQSGALTHSTYTIATLANDYWQFSQSLALKKFALIGLSVGGMWATEMALNQPEAISALVLMDTYVGAEPKTTQAVYLGMLNEIEAAQQLTADLAGNVAPYFFAKDTFREKPEVVKTFIQSLITAPAQHIAGKVALDRAIFTRDCLLNKLSQIKVRTLVIVGAGDLPRPVAEAQEMVKLIPNARLEIIPKAGHICTLEQPERVNQVLREFLNQHC